VLAPADFDLNFNRRVQAPALHLMLQISDKTRHGHPLAIVGASARAASASADRAGFQPLAADLFADADLRPIATATRISPYPEGLLDWLRTVEPPAWMYTGALENHPDLVDQMAWIAPLWGNPGDVLQRVRSPWQLAEAIRSAGLLFPETRSSPDGLPLDGTWLAKTYRGASGSGVREWSGEHGARSREQGEESTGAESNTPRSVLLAPCCYQRRVVGIPATAVFVAAGGRAQLLGITRQLVGEGWLGAHGFQYAGSIGPWPVSDLAFAAVKKLGDVLAKEFELIGLFGVDLVIDDDDVWTIEVNPRYTASVEVVERATGVSAIHAHATACRDFIIPNTQSEIRDRPAFHGKAILFAKREITISESFAASSLAEALRNPWPALADVSPAGTPIDVARPILTVFADGNSVDEVERRLHKCVAEIEAVVYAGQ
jgi:uncharacterized protein